MATIPLARYLWERISEIGVKTVLGVPGDFNLDILDHIYETEGLRWVGTANELNGAYAADGYARVRGLPGVLVTTYGVGELSAINGVCGAYAEQLKIIHIVGQTSRKMQQNRMLIHHAIDNDPDHSVYTRVSAEVRVAAAKLRDTESAPAEIDRVIRECFVQNQPVYIFFPIDMAEEQVPKSLLEKKIDLSLPINEAAQEAPVQAIKEAFAKAENPCVFIDGLVFRHQAVQETRNLVEVLEIPVYCSNMGKHVLEDTHKHLVGVYNGVVSEPGVAEAALESDLVLVLGSIPADTNTGGFTRKFAKGCIEIDVRPFEVQNVFMKPLLAALAKDLSKRECPMPKLPNPIQPDQSPTDRITQSWVWPRLAQFFESGDVVLGDSGTCTFGLHGQTFPAGAWFQAQTYYGSIGWATPATLGSELAITDGASDGKYERKRTILVTGDGSFGLTMQELGTMITNKLAPMIFIINNAGYTIERIIHGARQPYNDINKVNYAQLLPLFSHPEPQSSFHKCVTPAELEDVLGSLPNSRPKHTIVVEIIMDKLDVPWRLSSQLALRGPQQLQEMRDEGFIGWQDGSMPKEWVKGRDILEGRWP